MRWRGHFKTYH